MIETARLPITVDGKNLTSNLCQELHNLATNGEKKIAYAYSAKKADG
ncbi:MULTISPECIES: hypothetical protein [Shewanella]|nr:MULTISPECIES: hypothetical protein [Shewanella]